MWKGIERAMRILSLVVVALALSACQTTAPEKAPVTQALAGGITHVFMTVKVASGANVPVEMYLPASAGPASGVLVFPTYYANTFRRTETFDRDYAVALARQGYATAVPMMVHHGVRAYHPDYGPDLRALSDWFRARPEVGDDRIGAVGFSVGAYMAATLAAADPATRAVVGYYGSYDMTKHSPWAADHATMPARNADRINAAVLLLHGTSDNETPLSQAADFRDALAAAKKTFEMVAYPGAFHRFDRGPSDVMGGSEVDRRNGYVYRLDAAARDDSWRRSLEWLDRNLR
jgi:carboxymethylenebutenolidase